MLDVVAATPHSTSTALLGGVSQCVLSFDIETYSTVSIKTFGAFKYGRGRDGHCWPPPAQIPACGATAPGSYLG
jgi:hypothetical protein